jgi:hypothetical protein
MRAAPNTSSWNGDNYPGYCGGKLETVRRKALIDAHRLFPWTPKAKPAKKRVRRVKSKELTVTEVSD